jgi:hypothetical protein
LSGNDFSGSLAALFWLAPSGHRGRENRRMTDAVHDQHWRLAARAIMTAS